MKLFTTFITTLSMVLPVSAVAQNSPFVISDWNQEAGLLSGSNPALVLGIAGPVAGLHHNVLVVGGGANFPEAMPWQNGAKRYYREFFAYTRDAQGKLQQQAVFSLDSAIAYAAVCNTPEGILVAGGENESGWSNRVFLLQWDPVKKSVYQQYLPSLPMALTNASATLVGNRVLVAGGENQDGSSSGFISLDLSDLSRGWINLPPIPQPLSHTVMLTRRVAGKDWVFLAGGRAKNKAGLSVFSRHLFAYDLSSHQWHRKQNLPAGISAGTGLALDDHHIVLFGGDRGLTFHQVERLLLSIGNEKDPAKKNEQIARKNKLQESHPGFSRDILLYDIRFDKWTRAGEIPFETPVTTLALQWEGSIIIPSGEIRAGVRSPYFLTAKIRPGHP